MFVILDVKYLKMGVVIDIIVNSYIEYVLKLIYFIGVVYIVLIGIGLLQVNFDYGWQGCQVVGNQDKVLLFMVVYGVVNGCIVYIINDNIMVVVVVSNIFDKYYVCNLVNNCYYMGFVYEESGELWIVFVIVQFKFQIM